MVKKTKKEVFPDLSKINYNFGKPEIYIHAKLKEKHATFFSIQKVCNNISKELEPFYLQGIHQNKQTCETFEEIRFKKGIEVGKYKRKSTITTEIIFHFRFIGLNNTFSKETHELKKKLAFYLRKSITYDTMNIHYSFSK